MKENYWKISSRISKTARTELLLMTVLMTMQWMKERTLHRMLTAEHLVMM